MHFFDLTYEHKVLGKHQSYRNAILYITCSWMNSDKILLATKKVLSVTRTVYQNCVKHKQKL